MYKKFDKIIYIIRDPRAVILSAAKFRDTDYIQRYKGEKAFSSEEYLTRRFERLLFSWCRRILKFLEISNNLNIYTVFYENLKQDPEKEIRYLAEYLEVQISKSSIIRIKDVIDISSMRKDNPKHIRKGDLYEWRGPLVKQLRKVDRIAGDILDLFAYPRKNEKYPDRLAVPKINRAKINKIKKRLLLNASFFAGIKILRESVKEKIRNSM